MSFGMTMSRMSPYCRCQGAEHLIVLAWVTAWEKAAALVLEKTELFKIFKKGMNIAA